MTVCSSKKRLYAMIYHLVICVFTSLSTNIFVILELFFVLNKFYASYFMSKPHVLTYIIYLNIY